MRLNLPLPQSMRTGGADSFPTGIRRVVERARSRPLLIAAAIFFVVNNVVNAYVGWLVISGRLDGKWYDFRDLGIAVGQLREGLDDRYDPAVSYIVTAVIGSFVILNFVGVMLILLVWVERRLLARFQVRRGPNRVGPFGLLQPLADAIKMIQKETVIPWARTACSTSCPRCWSSFRCCWCGGPFPGRRRWPTSTSTWGCST